MNDNKSCSKGTLGSTMDHCHTMYLSKTGILILQQNSGEGHHFGNWGLTLFFQPAAWDKWGYLKMEKK